MFGKKSLNLVKNWGRKPNNWLNKKRPNLIEDGIRKLEKIKQETSLGLFCLLGGSGCGFNKLITFLYWSHCGPCY